MVELLTPWGVDFEANFAYLEIGEETGLELSQADAKTTILRMADRNRFNPVRDYFDSFSKVEGNTYEALDKHVETIFLLEDAALRKAVIIWLVGAVKRVYEPGCKFDLMLILQGTEGTNKSRFFQTLGGEFYSSIKVLDYQKDTMMAIQSSHIIEVDECDSSLRTRHTGTTKSIISTAMDEYRAPYASAPKKHKRRSVFGGTTNAKELFLESGDNRRYIMLRGYNKSHKVNVDYLAEHRDEIWSLAKAIYKDNPDVYIQDDLQQHLAKTNSESVVKSLEEEELVDFLSTRKHIYLETRQDIYPVYYGECGKPTRSGGFDIKRIMEKGGWKLAVRRINGKNKKAWLHETWEQPQEIVKQELNFKATQTDQEDDWNNIPE